MLVDLKATTEKNDSVPVVMPARRVSFIVLVFIVAAIVFVSARAVTVIAAGTIVATCFGRARS